jgi:endo-1,4-beta-xylanase
LPSTFRWTSTAPLITAVPDADHPILSVKDPSVVFFDGAWHVFATTADEDAQWSLVYLTFRDWSEAGDAELQFLDQNPALGGYHAAPQVFYFEPHEKWYLVFQSQQPQYSTTEDITDPMSWAAPTNFFAEQPAIVTENAGEGNWLDYWVICDATHCYLFFTDDNGHFYRSRTSLGDFPRGFDDTVIAIDGTKTTVFEGSATYRVAGTEQYLTLIEAFGNVGERYYRSFVANTLDGEWTPLAASIDNPFAARGNVAFEDGTAWTMDISHGELLRAGHDQTLTIDPSELGMLYQGVDPAQTGVEYYALPYKLGLLTYSAEPVDVTPGPETQTSACSLSSVAATEVIATFDDGMLSGFWSSYDESPDATHDPMAAESPGAAGTSHALHFTGMGHSIWGANFGKTPGCTDTSAFDGLSFYAKGSSGTANELHVIAQVAAALPFTAGGDCASDCYSHPRTTIVLSEDWVRFDLPFSAFRHPGWGVVTEYDGTVMGFAFESAGPDFDVWIDELRLYSGIGPSESDAGVLFSDAGASSPADAGTEAVLDAGMSRVPDASAEAGATGDAGGGL